MKTLVCKECGKSREIGRRLCKECNIKRVRQYPRYTWTKVCEACKCEFEAWRRDQSLCITCYRESQQLRSEHKSTNNYIFAKIPGSTSHRNLVESILRRKLSYNEVVHHIDGNPKNNEMANLLVISRVMHGKLHLYLDLQRVILEKSGIENIENCWKTLIVPMTTAWLETTNANVIKIWEIGQSAAEPLKQKCKEEGSETMHDVPDH